MAERRDTASVAGGRRRGRFVRAALAVLLLIGLVGAGGGAAVAQEGGDPAAPAQPAEVSDQVRDVMDRPEFDYSPSAVERLFEWIGEQLAKLFEPGEGSSSGASFGGGIGSLFAWLIIVVAVAALVAVVVWVVANRTRRQRPDEDDPLTPTEVEHRRAASEWMADAERWEAAGEWKEALRARYRNLVRVLVDRRQLADVPGRTTGELRADLDVTTPDAREDFDTCCVLFELAWYADVPTGPEENQRLRRAADAVLAAPAVDRFDPVLLFDVAGVARERADVEPPGSAADDGADGDGGDADVPALIGGSPEEDR